MKKITYTPSRVCCKEMEIKIEDDIVLSVKFHGGCNGNLAGISRLVEGRSVESVISTLKGIDCNGKGTSCPDQLAQALELNR